MAWFLELSSCTYLNNGKHESYSLDISQDENECISTPVNNSTGIIFQLNLISEMKRLVLKL